MKTFVTPQSTNKAFTVKASKIKGKKNDKLSPEYKLGLGIERLLEQGVRVEKIDDVINTSNGRGDKKLLKKSFGRATNKNICLVKAKPKRRRRRFTIVNGNRVRISKLKKQSSEKDPNSTNIKFDTVKNAVKACLENLKKFQSSNQLLDDGVPLNLQVCCIIKPVTPKRFVRFQLPNSYIDDVADVCLIVQDQKSWNNKIQDPELTINEVQDFLRANNITSIKKIITMHQVKTDYMTYELRRKLCNSYDFFLADNRLREDIFSALGRDFQKTRKAPVAIHLKRGNLQERISRALAKTTMKISSDQDVFNCQIGHSKQDIDQISENIVAVGQQLDKLFPGSFKNVRSVSIKSARSIAFPVYYTTRSINEVATPIVTPKRPKLYEVVTDELSTIGKLVHVHPDGTVTVVEDEKSNKSPKKKLNVEKPKKSPVKNSGQKDNTNDNQDKDDVVDSDEEFKFYSSNDEDFDDDDENEVDSDSNSPFRVEKNKKKKTLETDDSAVDDSDDSGNDDSDSDDDEFSRKTEEAYLQSLGVKADSDDDNEEEEEKEELVVKDNKVKENKKRKTAQNKDVTNVSAKKFKVSISPDQSSSSKRNNNTPHNKEVTKVSAKKFKASISPDQSSSSKENDNRHPEQNTPPSKKKRSRAGRRKPFDTSLGETWTIKKKCDAPMGEKRVMKKKAKSKAKLTKSQKRGNLKMKKAKLNKD